MNYKPIKIDSSNLFFTSDTHFGHKNIIDFCKRPFFNVEEMNETLIENWNSIIPEDGEIFVLGDFAFGNHAFWEYIINRLNGKIHLIIGNHDRRALSNHCDKLFESINFQLQLNINNKIIDLNHYPFLCYAGSYRGENSSYNLFAHVHTSNKLEYNTGLDFERLSNLFPTQYDVGVDFNNYKPISYIEIKEKIEFQIENNVNLTCWIK